MITTIIQSVSYGLIGLALAASSSLTGDKLNQGSFKADLKLSQEITLKSTQADQISTHAQLLTSPLFTLPKSKIKPKLTSTQPAAKLPESSYDHLFDQYGSQFGVSPLTLKSIAYCESHFNPMAQSKNGLYGGLFQYSASTWQSTRTAMGVDPNPALRFDAEQSILTSAYKIAAGGIGAWPHCGRHFH